MSQFTFGGAGKSYLAARRDLGHSAHVPCQRALLNRHGGGVFGSEYCRGRVMVAVTADRGIDCDGGASIAMILLSGREQTRSRPRIIVSRKMRLGLNRQTLNVPAGTA